MMNLNDTISAFRCCTQIPPMCKECPLTEMCKWNLSKDRCKNEVKLSVNHWLKAQEPRLMSLGEVQKIASIRDGAIWLEAGAGLMPAFMEFAMKDITFFVAVPLTGYRQFFENDWYGKTWRCWTSRPTDEQREETPWQQ